jgi:signal transduction histidine kinase
MFKMIVQDNGDGFDISSKVFGNGLNNIKRRAERIKAQIELDSELKIGTRWKLKVQL